MNRLPYPASKKAIKPIPHRFWRDVVKAELWSTSLTSVWIYAVEEFNERIVKHGNNCWGWLGAWHRQGYPLVVVQRPMDKVKSPKMNGQRLAMAIHLGRALDHNERVACTCRNLSCTNPDHLFITDYKNQHKHIDYSGLPPRRRKYLPSFFIQNKDVLETMGAVRLARLFKITRGQGISMKRAYNRWVSGL